MAIETPHTLFQEIDEFGNELRIIYELDVVSLSVTQSSVTSVFVLSNITKALLSQALSDLHFQLFLTKEPH